MGEHRDGVGGGLGEVWHKAIQEEEEKAFYDSDQIFFVKNCCMRLPLSVAF